MRISKLVYLSVSIITLFTLTESGHIKGFKGFKDFKNTSYASKKNIITILNKEETKKTKSTVCREKNDFSIFSKAKSKKRNTRDIIQKQELFTFSQKEKIPSLKKSVFSNNPKALYSRLSQHRFNSLTIDSVLQGNSISTRSYTKISSSDDRISKLTDKDTLKSCVMKTIYIDKEIILLDDFLARISKIIVDETLNIINVGRDNIVKENLEDSEYWWRKRLNELSMEGMITRQIEKNDTFSARIHPNQIKQAHYSEKQTMNIETSIKNINMMIKKRNYLLYNIL